MIDALPILTERLVIRQFRATDAAAFHSWRSDAAVARYTLWDHPYPIEEAEAFCREQAALTELPIGDWCQLFIEERDTGSAIGDIGLGLKPDGDEALHVGYSLHRDHWRKGYAAEAVGASIPVIAQAIGVTLVKAEIDARNPASGRVLEKMGFKVVDKPPRRAFVKGEWCDEIDYVLEIGLQR